MPRLILIAAILAAGIQAALAGETITGVPWIIDGDTIDIHGTRIRLFGIDAPEIAQTCERAERAWRCGESAKWTLIRFVAHRPVRCEARDTDRYGRAIAVCFLGRTDINRWMVMQGWAVAYTHYSSAYAGAEQDARTHHRGIWASRFEQPWKWRWTHPH